jgi:hypothetical protein
MSKLKFSGSSYGHTNLHASTDRAVDDDDEVIFEINESCVWAKAGNSYFPTQQVVKEIPPGQYTVMETQRGICLVNHEINLDDILILPDSSSDEVINELELFWSKKDKFKENRISR